MNRIRTLEIILLPPDRSDLVEVICRLHHFRFKYRPRIEHNLERADFPVFHLIPAASEECRKRQCHVAKDADVIAVDFAIRTLAA